jgi:hypothetical protein
MDLNDLAKNPEQLKNLINLLQQMLPTEEDQETDQSSNEEFTAPLRTKGSKRKMTKSTNKFLSMSEKDMHKDDVAIDKKLAKFPPVSRSRDFDMIDVVCRVCGRKETISPALLFDAPDRYKCNNCSTSAG